MQKRKGVFLSVLLALFLFALTTLVSAATPTVVSACGQTINAAGFYQLNQSVNSSGACLTIGASNVLLDGNGFTMNYSQSGFGNGINTSIGVTNITIKNFNIIQGSTTTSSMPIMLDSPNSTVYSNNITFNSNSYGIQAHAADGINLSNNNITNFGTGSIGIHLYFSSYHYVSNNRITSNNTGGAAIYSGDIDHSVITQNIVTASGRGTSGLEVRISTNNTYSQNNITTTGNFSYGIYSPEGPSANRFNANILNTLATAIVVGNDNANFTSNTIINNGQAQLNTSGVTVVTRLINQPISIYQVDPIGADISIENTTYGIVDFALVNGTGNNLVGNSSSDVIFGNNSIYINTSASSLNSSVNITLYNIGERSFRTAVAYRDGSKCTDCSDLTVLDPDTFFFNTIGGGNYSVGEGYVAPSTGSSSGSSSGGGSGSSTPSKVYELNEANIKDGYINGLTSNQQISFMINGEVHTLTLNSYNATHAKVTIKSEPQILLLPKNAVTNVDVNGNGANDIFVRYDGIKNNQAVIALQLLETQPTQEETPPTEMPKEDNTVVPPALPAEKKPYTLWIIIGIIVIVIGIFGFIRLKNN